MRRLLEKHFLPLTLTAALCVGTVHGAADPTPVTNAAQESIDLAMYTRIREEGDKHSRVMDYAAALADDIGPRLTGSTNLDKANAWAVGQLVHMGVRDARVVSWGNFGMRWQQNNAWARMLAPDAQVLSVQAAPWSPATDGAVRGAVVMVTIYEDAQFEQYRGKLAGKIVLLGPAFQAPEGGGPLIERYDDAALSKLAAWTPPAQEESYLAAYLDTFGRLAFREKAGRFLADEGALAVIVPSGSGSGGVASIDSNDAFGWYVFQRAHAMRVPLAVMTAEHYGRVSRLLAHKHDVMIELTLDTAFDGDDRPGTNVIADIPGTDPRLQDEVVMLGAHLDSWTAATGATDNAAGVAVAMEAMRILTALQVKPRRTIRIALWGGEEQGLLGSRAYVQQQFGGFPGNDDPAQAVLPEFLRTPGGKLSVTPAHARISAYYNLDEGGGRLRGISTQGNAELVPIFRQWNAPLHDLGVTTVTMKPKSGSDFESFDAVGIPGFQFIQDPLDFFTRTFHTNQDLLERLSADDLKQAAIVEAIFVYNTAMRDQLLPRKPLPQP